MRVLHRPADGEQRILATDVAVADSFGAKLRGLRFRSSLPDGFALVFPFGDVGRRDIDMLFVRTAIDVLWLIEDEVARVETLRPWLGIAIERADCVIELPPGAADGVEPGDRVVVEPPP